MYKIVHKEFGCYPVWFSRINDAEEFLEIVVKHDGIEKSQLYIRKLNR